MRRTRILTAVLALAAGLPAGTPPAAAASAPEATTLAPGGLFEPVQAYLDGVLPHRRVPAL
ncbi:hypothetical protein GCM10011579_080670 [Streptomyces albiflavescens]|uniref:Uncharacterized protein n=1 Tax=Streptomyces albiflavescens TaxID=1623582 RepID=A0A918D8T2_9ACTN|nr:hypothetical protein [Streptomyces albiflavescens]GGN87648.1 hypothetical protein GCM10011579_080670 [Streptomyces albiflavescens]